MDGDTLFVGRFWISFQRTLRVPDDGRDYPLPPGLGPLPLVPVERCGGRLPLSMREAGSFVLPMYQREALWLAFGGTHWKPNAVKVGVGSVNAVTGAGWDEALEGDPQNYLVCPGQPWLDGFVTGRGEVRQFVAMPLGAGYTVEEQLSTADVVGGIRLLVYEPKSGRFPEAPPATGATDRPWSIAEPAMGLGAGGKIRQRLYVDPHGVETWDVDRSRQAVVHILNSMQFRAVTGEDPPPTPVDARTYTEHGLPWFTLYDEHQEALPATDRLRRVRSIGELGEDDDEDVSFEVHPEQIRGLGRPDG
ncbi:MAG TPA: hypothetical protein VGV86_03835 [Acidimicrobiales bacterium]|nr:hypothetical protein [Acidimicrobiales bacterium]